ncbi:hypothetical protein DL546_005042 [Coniochaeta pulveracea]|uniref:Zn(2)-C6 fungal-type domain-containing protein n=1 Tax=Coniochaeta pulveracea TaxID=177199 RepID=A0A420Y2C9_9PEZI|nr:hypothetical protein DL546_005042 [Coniochaeta pulveracea]
MGSIRGRAACDGCRSRKQKCDETKPVCSRCRDLNRQCLWPRTHKRGPVKGYADVLKQRLEETENALLRLLSATDDRTIAAAFADSTAGQSLLPRYRDIGGTDVPGSAELKKAALVTHWDRFPLKTSEEVMSWARAVRKASDPTVLPSSGDSQVNCRIQVPGRELPSGGMDGTGVGEIHVRQTLVADEEGMTVRQDEQTDEYTNRRMYSQDTTHSREPVVAHHEESSPTNITEPQHNTTAPPSDLQQEKEQSLELSQEFKQQYLW